MQRISCLWQASSNKLFAIGLMLLTVISSFVIYGVAPSYAGTYAEQKLVPSEERLLTPEEKIERAYEFGEGAGMLEERKQASRNANNLTEPGDKMNEKSVTTPKSEQGLVEKAKELIEKVNSK